MLIIEDVFVDAEKYQGFKARGDYAQIGDVDRAPGYSFVGSGS
jgi:hypothetical protein